MDSRRVTSDRRRTLLDKQLELNGRNHKVIGIMPARFHVNSWFPASTQGWIPIAWTDKERAVRGNHNWRVVARLRDGVSLAKAQSAMDVLSDRLARDYPEENKGWGAIVTTLRDDLVGDVRPALLTLLGAVGFVLLIACANTANLVLARTIARRKELAIRAALGASKRELLRPVLIETTLLAAAGGALGLLVARFGQALVTGRLGRPAPSRNRGAARRPRARVHARGLYPHGTRGGPDRRSTTDARRSQRFAQTGPRKNGQLLGRPRYAQGADCCRDGAVPHSSHWRRTDDPHLVGAARDGPRFQAGQRSHDDHADSEVFREGATQPLIRRVPPTGGGIAGCSICRRDRQSTDGRRRLRAAHRRGGPACRGVCASAQRLRAAGNPELLPHAWEFLCCPAGISPSQIHRARSRSR